MKKRLMKSQTNKVLTGTIGGIAEYFGVDPTVARVIYIFFSMVLVGAPILLYVLLALVIPKNGGGNPAYEGPMYQTKRQRKKAEKTDEDVWNDF